MLLQKGYNKKYPTEEMRLEARRMSSRSSQKKYHRKYRSHKMQKQFGITIEQFEEMWKVQKGLCAICLRELKFGTHNHAIDHNHKTGRVRGILCGKCNTSIGALNEDLDTLQRAIIYLKKYG